LTQRILVWDAPTRAFHWLQAFSFFAAFLTACPPRWTEGSLIPSFIASERYRDLHIAFGYILFGLLVFRLLWGFVGTRYARFASFLFKPGEIATYLLSLIRNQPRHYVGHNPAGSLAIWLLLSLGLTLGVTGVMLLQDDVADVAVDIHAFATNAMLVVVAIHLLGVAVSSVMHHENLVRTMVTGIKPGEPGEEVSKAYNWLAVAMAAAVALFWFVYVK
jgi:cytochrome b